MISVGQDLFCLNSIDYDDIYFKVSIDSDFKADGTRGLFGSTAGEWGIRSVKLLGGIAEVDDPPSAPRSLEVYKTSAKTAVLTWEKGFHADRYDIYLKKGNGSCQKVRMVTSPDRIKYKLENLSSGVVCKLRMQSYFDSRKGKIYSSYSKAVTLNMKEQPLPKNLSIKKSLSIKAGQKKQ